MKCWPSIQDSGLICLCGEFKISGVRWDIAQKMWREHFIIKYMES